MAATVQVAESFSQVQPRIMQTSASKSLWAGCASRRMNHGFDCISLGDCPATCSKAVCAAKGLPLSSLLVGCLVQAVDESSLGLHPSKALLCCCVSLQTCLFCCQPATAGPSRERGLAAPVPQRGTSSLLLLPRCPSTAPLQKLWLRVQCRHLWDTRAVGLATVGLLLLAARVFASHSQVGPQGFCKMHCDKKWSFDKDVLEKKNETLPFY